MANASKKHFGAGARGSGANTDIQKEKIGENMVLSNRDKSRHSAARGMDSKEIQSEQWQAHADNRFEDDDTRE